MYCRLSKDDGTDNESASIATQKSILTDYVKKQGWHLAKTYVDDGYSGTNFQRPSFQNMIKDIESGLINCVITKDLSRLGRNYLDCGLYLEVFFPEHNVRYIAVNDGVDTLNKSAMDITPFRNILNEMYSADVSVKIKSAYRARFQQGKFMGTTAPYGYIKDPADHNHLLIDDKVAHVVREIFDLALAGNGIAKIRKHINKQHILRPAAYAVTQGATGYERHFEDNEENRYIWSENSIRGILRSPIYAGNLAGYKRIAANMKSRKRPSKLPEEWEVIPDTHEGIVTQEEFDTVQQLMTSRRREQNAGGFENIFSGVIKCADCGYAMRAASANRRKRPDIIDCVQYTCNNYGRYGNVMCTAHSIEARDLFNAVLADINRFAKMAVNDEKAVRAIEKRLTETDQSMAKALEKEQRKLNKRLAELDRLFSSLYEDKVMERITERNFEMMSGKYQKEQLEIEARLKEVKEASATRQEKLEQDSAEKIDETLLFHGESGRFAIYQMDTGGEHTYQFMGFESAKKLGYTIEGKDYRMVYAAPWTPTITLEDIFERFNINRPNDFHGHSLSVSDVIVINRTAETKAYYVDSFGFEELPDFVQQRMEMLENNHTRAYPPVYKGTLAQAMEERDVDAYLDSRKLNIDCKKAIEEAIALNFDGLHLKEDVAKQVLEQFGEERMTFVMANTLRELSYDGRFSKQNKDWAEHIEIPENINQGKNLNQDYVIESHPAVLDGFIDMARAEIRMQKIEQALDEAEVTITADTRGFEADGHAGTWHTVDEREYAGEKFFFMEHDEYGSDVAGIIVSEHGQLVAEDLWNGYDAGALEAISEYLQEKGISVEGLMPELEPDELAYKIDDRYFAIQRTEEGYDYTFYALDYDEIDGGAYDNPDISMQQAMEDILEDEEMSLENAVPVDYEDLMAEVEEAGERQMQLAQLLKNCPPSIFEDYDRKRAVDTCEGIVMQFTKSKGYLTVQATEEGYFYIFYDSDLHEIHSNDYDDPKVSVQKATYEILKSERMDDMECVKVDYKEFEAMTIQHSKDLLQSGELRATSEIGRDEAALNGLSRAEVERGVLYHAQGILEDMGLENEVELLAARVHGSRSREELYRDDSDLDVVLSYRGNIREDSFFNELNAHGIAMAGIKVDINPIAEERITLAEYMKESEAYLDQKEIEKLAVDLDNFSYEYDTYEYKDIVENREEQVKKITEDILNKKTGCLKDWLVEVSEESDIDSDVITARSLLSRLENAETFSIFTRQSEQEQPEATISFYVAECMEFPVMGEYHNNLTLEEAIKIYESIPAERLHGIKGIGFDLQDGDEDYSGEYGLMSGDRIDRDLIDMIPHYKESPLVQKAINDMEKYLNEKHGKVQEAEQTVEVKQKVSETPFKKESVSVEPNREQNKEPAKGGKGELKKSVLQSLKEFQARAKAQEQKEMATEKSKAHKKGNIEL